MTDIPYLTLETLRAVASEVLLINDVQIDQRGNKAVPRFIGQLRVEAQTAHDAVAPRFQALGYTALLQDEQHSVVLEAMPGIFQPKPSRLWVAVLLFVLTLVCTFMVGSQDIVGGKPAFNLGYGISYSVALLSILLAHELGHFIVARRAGVAVSYPFFIPLTPPLGILGTMGAFISI
ncbi:MAG: site-2 protease family protein, partial [Oscillochloris sp.]|nr:site-2 protease family protein [Oscillochloris sp.]